MAPGTAASSSTRRVRPSSSPIRTRPDQREGRGSLASDEALEIGLRLAASLRHHADRVSGLRALAHEISRALHTPVAVWASEGSRLVLLGDHHLARGRHEALVWELETWALDDPPTRQLASLGEGVRRIFDVPAVSVIDVDCGVLVLGRSAPEVERVHQELATLLRGLPDTGSPPGPGQQSISGADAQPPPEPARLASLTPREREVLVLIESGEGTRAIAEHLSISPKTVKTHVQNIFGKLRVGSRLEAGAFARRNGFPEPALATQELLPLE